MTIDHTLVPLSGCCDAPKNWFPDSRVLHFGGVHWMTGQQAGTFGGLMSKVLQGLFWNWYYVVFFGAQVPNLK
jgi:hypothetical protein